MRRVFNKLTTERVASQVYFTKGEYPHEVSVPIPNDPAITAWTLS